MQVEPVINARNIANPPLAVALIPRGESPVNGLMMASSMPSLFQHFENPILIVDNPCPLRVVPLGEPPKQAMG